MICPRCSKNTLEERERDGITIDICQECRGIWLDRGELERLIAKANQEMEIQMDVSGRQPRHDDHDDYRKHHSHDHHGHGDSHHHRKRHWLAELFD